MKQGKCSYEDNVRSVLSGMFFYTAQDIQKVKQLSGNDFPTNFLYSLRIEKICRGKLI
jgi:hypothetical protein